MRILRIPKLLCIANVFLTFHGYPVLTNENHYAPIIASLLKGLQTHTRRFILLYLVLAFVINKESSNLNNSVKKEHIIVLKSVVLIYCSQ